MWHKIKLPLSPGEYMFVTGVVYFVTGMYNVFVHQFVASEIISATWMLVLLIPVLLPVGRLVRGAPFWRT